MWGDGCGKMGGGGWGFGVAGDEEEVIYLDDVDVSDADTEDSGDDANEINDAFVLLD